MCLFSTSTCHNLRRWKSCADWSLFITWQAACCWWQWNILIYTYSNKWKAPSHTTNLGRNWKSLTLAFKGKTWRIEEWCFCTTFGCVCVPKLCTALSQWFVVKGQSLGRIIQRLKWKLRWWDHRRLEKKHKTSVYHCIVVMFNYWLTWASVTGKSKHHITGNPHLFSI